MNNSALEKNSREGKGSIGFQKLVRCRGLCERPRTLEEEISRPYPPVGEKERKEEEEDDDNDDDDDGSPLPRFQTH